MLPLRFVVEEEVRLFKQIRALDQQQIMAVRNALPRLVERSQVKTIEMVVAPV